MRKRLLRRGPISYFRLDDDDDDEEHNGRDAEISNPDTSKKNFRPVVIFVPFVGNTV